MDHSRPQVSAVSSRAKVAIRRQQFREVESRNVIAKLEGAARPDEYIIYTAHWDHFGVDSTRLPGNAVFNAIELSYLLRGERQAVPGRWLAARPGLDAEARREPGETMPLFP